MILKRFVKGIEEEAFFQKRAPTSRPDWIEVAELHYASGTSAEEVNLLGPAAGNYTVIVHGWGVPGSSPFKLHTWLLGSADAGNMTVVAPATAETGETGTINLTFSGLDPATRYLGSVAYGGAASATNPTIVSQIGMLSLSPGATNFPSRPMMMPAMITPMMSTATPFTHWGRPCSLALPVSPSRRGSIRPWGSSHN
jgi:hypothetical protein